MPAGFSYSGFPSFTPVDEVRFLLADTDPDDFLAADAEIEYALERAGDRPRAAAAIVARSIAAKLARSVGGSGSSIRIGDASSSIGGGGPDAAKHYLALADKLDIEALSIIAVGGIYAGGISVAEKAIVESDPDRVKPAFKVDQHNFPTVSGPRPTET